MHYAHKSRFEKILSAAGVDCFDDYDRWGWAMGLFADVASVLDMTDIEGDVTPQPFDRWEYRRAPFTVPAVEDVAARAEDFSEGEFADDYTYGQVSLAYAYVNGSITQDDLIYAGDVLDRYTAALWRAGLYY